jgi:outer membrane protein
VNRSYKLFLSTVLVVAGFVSVAQAAELKIGVVNYARLMQDSPQAKAVLEAIRTEFSPLEKEVQTRGATLKAREDKLQKDAATMSDAQRSAAEKELRDGYRDLQKRQSEVQDDFNARRNEETTRLQRILIEEVQAYAKAQSFDLILSDGVLFATNNIDITPAVLAALESKRSTAPARPASKP